MKNKKEWQMTVYANHDNSDSEFFRSPEWIKLRRDCFARDNYTCIRCEDRYRSDLLTAHHVIPRAEGGANLLSNLVTLCSPCHDFVELNGYKNIPEIIGSFESEKPEAKVGRPVKIKDDENRPEWHKWVYGGVKKRD